MEYANDMDVIFLRFREKNGSLNSLKINITHRHMLILSRGVLVYHGGQSVSVYKCLPVNTMTYTVFQASNIFMVITSLKASQSDVWKQENQSHPHSRDAVGLNAVYTVKLNLDHVSILQKLTEKPVNNLHVFRKKQMYMEVQDFPYLAAKAI